MQVQIPEPGSKLLPSKKGCKTYLGFRKDYPRGEWDSQHGEVEVYNKNGKHQGTWNPETGEENEGKQRDGRRTTYRIGSEEPDAGKQ
jgi:hypothetical protein